MVEIQSDIPKQKSNHMEGEIIFKSRISYSHILWILAVFLFITQVNCFINKDFFNKTAWLIYGMLIMWAYIFNLFFTSSFEVTSDYLKVKFPSILFFLKPKIYMFCDIEFAKIVYLRSKVEVPYISIKFKNKELIVNHFYFLISKKSIKEMVLILNDQNVNVSYCDKYN